MKGIVKNKRIVRMIVMSMASVLWCLHRGNRENRKKK